MTPSKLLFALIAIMIFPAGKAQQREDVFADPENLKVLPTDISTKELRATMRGFSTGLGVRCEACHVGKPGTPLSTFDFASDEKLMKQKARLMLQMLDEINGELVSRLDEVENTNRISVRCITCHRGQSQPKLIEDVLDEQLAAEGLDATVEKYKSLRDQYYGSHSYDFSEFILPMYTQGLAANGQTDAAIALAELNAEFFPESYYTMFTLGEFYVAVGQVDSAIEKYQRALKLNPRAEGMLKPRIEALTRE